jgi:hypothetical protein
MYPDGKLALINLYVTEHSFTLENSYYDHNQKSKPWIEFRKGQCYFGFMLEVGNVRTN